MSAALTLFGEPDTKRCSRCKQERKKQEFSRDKNSSDGLESRCRACRREYDKARNATPERRAARASYERSPEVKAKYDERRRARCAGWPPGRWREHWERHGGCCECCGIVLLDGGKGPRAACADHAETATGKVPRGMLCRACNLGCVAQYDRGGIAAVQPPMRAAVVSYFERYPVRCRRAKRGAR